MVTCEVYTQNVKGDWDRFIESCKSPLFFFKRDFMEYHADRFIDNSLMFYVEGTLVAVLPASKHDDTLMSHGGLTYGGLLLSPKVRIETVIAIVEQLLVTAQQNGFKKIVYKSIPYIFHHQPNQEDSYALFNRANAKLIRRDLSSVIQLDRRLPLSKGRKWLIARAKKSNLTISTSTNWDTFYDLLCSVLDKHDARPVHTAAEMHLLHSRFPQNIELKVVEHEAEIIAAALLFKFKNVVHTQYLSVSSIGKDLGALDYLLESIIQESASQGFEYFNFGISTEQNGRYLNEGLVAQKESFGARAVALDFYEVNINES